MKSISYKKGIRTYQNDSSVNDYYFYRGLYEEITVGYNPTTGIIRVSRLKIWSHEWTENYFVGTAEEAKRYNRFLPL